MRDINRKMTAGIAWMSVMRICIRGLGLISTVILARLLAPADFGLVAMAMSVIAGLELLRQLGFELVLIQRAQVERKHFDTVWTFNILLATTLAVLLVLLGEPAARFFNEPRVPEVMYALAVGLFISGFENVGTVSFRRELQFDKEFVYHLIPKIAALALTLPAAFLMKSYWALILGQVGSTVVLVALSYIVSPYRPRFSLAARGDFFGFSSWIFLTNLLQFFHGRSAHFLIGRFSGPELLGLYTLSREIATLPSTELIAPINRAVFPAYSRMASSLKTLGDGFLNIIGLVALLALPAGFGIAATAGLIVPVALGDQWTGAVPIVAILAISGSLGALQTNCAAVHKAMGRPRTLTMISLVHVACLLPSIVYGAVTGGVIGVAWAHLINAALVSLPLNYTIVLKRLHLPFSALVGRIWRPLVAASGMYAALSYVLDGIVSSSLYTLFGAVLFGAAVYTAILLTLWFVSGRPGGPERTIANNYVVPAWNRLTSMRAIR